MGLFKPLLDYTKELLGKKVEKVQISKHLVNSPVVVLSADYGWTAQMEKVMKSQAFADQSKFEFMKSKRMFEINPRHPMIVELNSRVKDSSADDATKDMVISLYLSGVIGAGYQLTPEDAMDFSERVSRMVTNSLGVDADAELAPELEIAADEPEEEEEVEEEEEEDAGADKDEMEALSSSSCRPVWCAVRRYMDPACRVWVSRWRRHRLVSLGARGAAAHPCAAWPSVDYHPSLVVRSSSEI